MSDSDPYKAPSPADSDGPAETLPNSTYWKLTALLGFFVVIPWLLALVVALVEPVAPVHSWVLDLASEVLLVSAFCAIPFVLAVINGVAQVLWYFVDSSHE